MEFTTIFAGLVLILAGLSAFLAYKLTNAKQDIVELAAEIKKIGGELIDAKHNLAKEKEVHQEKLNALEQAREQLKETFEATSAKALERNNRSFLELAKETLNKYHEKSKGELEKKEQTFENLVNPIKKSLSDVDIKLQNLERERESAYKVLRHQVQDLITVQKELRGETANLVKALRTPHVRGKWGEMQLRRVVEMSGMSTHCDFSEQVSYDGDSGKLRPDMVVNLPGGKQIIIDAKAPLAAYLDAIEAKDDSLKQSFLTQHAVQVKKHILSLAKRDYWDYVKDGDAPEFVVLFLPGESFFSAALEQDPALIELGVENKVILATPATLIALLHAVAYGWKQEALSQNAKEISAAGKELYKRLADMGGHFFKLGSDLTTAVKSYNKTVGTLERRVLPSTRKLKELEVSSNQVTVKEPIEIEHYTRNIQAPELTENIEQEKNTKIA